MTGYQTLIQLIKLVGGIIQVLLGLNAVLRLLGALPNTELFKLIYNLSEPLIAPFYGILPQIIISGRFVLDLTILFAMLAYLVITIVLIRLVALVFNRRAY